MEGVIDGIININKPKDITSFDVIRRLRRLLSTKRVGHTGTLDPLATGVMVVCLNRATRLASEIEALFKIYRVELLLGVETDSYDIKGNVLNKKEADLTLAEVESVINSFIGESYQLPPMYSAIKVNGQKLYELARKGQEIDRVKRIVNIEYIKDIELNRDDQGNLKVKFEAKVSKGTYIRSLAHDIGEKLLTGATVSMLERLAVGNFSINDSYTLEEVELLVTKADYGFITTVENHFSNLISFNLEDDQDYKLFKNGNFVKCSIAELEKVPMKIKVYWQGEFSGIALASNGYLKAYKYWI